MSDAYVALSGPLVVTRVHVTVALAEVSAWFRGHSIAFEVPENTMN